MERKLAAIVAGDIVGYSRLMSDDETGTYAALRAALSELIIPAVEHHGGRTFKTTGDGFLATFPSVNEALDAAIEIQNGFAERPFKMRLGINLGDVIEDNGDMFGDGVNVAARLEAMAEPNSIYVSEAVVRGADRSRGDLFYSVGRRQAKNIPELLSVYAVRAAGEASYQEDLDRQFYDAAVRPCRTRLVSAVFLFAIAFTQVPMLRALGEDVAHSIARSRGRRNRRFSSRRRGPAVRQSERRCRSGLFRRRTDRGHHQRPCAKSRTSGHRAQFDLRVARQCRRCPRHRFEDLGAGYVVEGSARRSGDQLRVVAQLIDARTGAHLWSNSYDRRVEDVFAVQNELTAEIVSHLVSYVEESEVASAASRPTENLQAYDLLLQARNRYQHGTKDADALYASRTLLHRALELDPAYAAARAALGLTYIADFAQSVSGKASKTDLETGLTEARQAVRLDPNLPMGYQVLSFGLSAGGDYAGALQAAQRAVELNPNDPDSLMALAKAQVRFGSYDEAVAQCGASAEAASDGAGILHLCLWPGALCREPARGSRALSCASA